MRAIKNDDGKARFDLIPGDALELVARVLTFGAKKYGDHNWRKGLAWSRMYAAAQRHLNAFWDGEDLDEETGLPHLAHALASICFLLVSQKRSLGADDRPGKVENDVAND